MIREEIRRIKANNPDISHREAFSTAAKNVRRSIHACMHSTKMYAFLRQITLITSTSHIHFVWQWAHYPNIHFGLNPERDGGKRLAVDDAAPAAKKIQGFCS